MSKLGSLLESYSDLPEFVEVTLIDVNQRGNFGNTPLHVAAVQGDVDAIELLLSAGADPNALGELGNTPLHDAVISEKLDVIAVLLRAGADPGKRNDDGRTPREVALLTKRAVAAHALDARK